MKQGLFTADHSTLNVRRKPRKQRHVRVHPPRDIVTPKKCLLRETNEPSLCRPDQLDSPSPAPRSSDMLWHWKRLLQGGTEMKLSQQGEEHSLRGWGCCLCWDHLGGFAFALRNGSPWGKAFRSFPVPTWPPTPEGSALFPEHPHPGISVLLAAAPARTHWKVREPQEGSCTPHM